jgi:hypothetical protein
MKAANHATTGAEAGRHDRRGGGTTLLPVDPVYPRPYRAPAVTVQPARPAEPDEPNADAGPVDDELFRSVFRRHAAGVAVVTAPGRPPVGFAATSVISVSLRPRLISFTVNPRFASRGTGCRRPLSWAPVVGSRFLMSLPELRCGRLTRSAGPGCRTASLDCHLRVRAVPSCAPGRTRTCDQMLRRHLLYPLSYGRIRLDAGRLPRPRAVSGAVSSQLPLRVLPGRSQGTGRGCRYERHGASGRDP